VASYRLFIKPSAAKEIEALPKQDRRRIVAKITSLSRDPRLPGCEKLSGHDRYRLRQGNYRILYEIQDVALIVVVVKVRHRRDIYRNRQ
jgi:mRNA interferase RelE/StbE